jgi:hypothetical protein
MTTPELIGTQLVLSLENIGPPDYELSDWQIEETLDELLDRAIEIGEQHSQHMIAAGRGPTPHAHRACTAYHAIEIIRLLQSRLGAKVTTPSTIDILNARLNGTDLPTPTKKPTKPDELLTRAQLFEAAALKDDLQARLRHGIWYVDFTKVDGTRATMECTLDPKHLPSSDPSVFAGAGRPEQPNLLHVFAVDRDGWRSFKVLNVISLKPKPESL